MLKYYHKISKNQAKFFVDNFVYIFVDKSKWWILHSFATDF